MNRNKTNRKVMTRAARRQRQATLNRARNRWIKIASVVAKGERWWHYAHEQDLTNTENEDIGAALADFLRDQWTNEVERNGHELEAMYHAGFYLSCAWLVFSATEAYELHDVFNRHRIMIHADWWLTDGWGDWHNKFGVRCEECGTYTYAHAERMNTDPGVHSGASLSWDVAMS